jgi:predicted AlkP superfamily phosphohydrolase/phosphomutase
MRKTMKKSSGARALIIGLDGADLSVIQALGPARLPHLHAAMDRGVYAAQQSVMPPATLPNWATFLTGVDPGVHGVFDFTSRHGYGVQFTAGRIREAPTFFRALDRAGKKTACLFFPGTYPPEPLEHGVFASGWDAPVAFAADASFMWPRSLHAELVARFGAQMFDDVDEFHADAPGFHDALGDALVRRIERRAELGLYLLGKQHWDAFALYFGETDTASHHLWSLWDERSPRHPQDASERARAGLARVYEAADRAVGALLEAAGGEEVELTIVSDHGSGGSSDKVLYLNRALEAAGLLRMHGSTRAASFGKLKDLALRVLPPALREQVFRLAGTMLPSWLESRVRFAAIDFARTTAFSDELNYLPAIHWNVRGREPNGQLAPADVPKARRELEAALFAIRDPWSGAPVVKAVHAREEIFSGPFVSRAPDLLLELELDPAHGSTYSYNLMPSAEARPGETFRKLDPREHLGRKGRSLAGSHRSHGLYAAAGPLVLPVGRLDPNISVHIADASATALARIGHAPVPHAMGKVLPVLHELDLPAGFSANPAAQPDSLPSRDTAQAPGGALSGERLVAERLRNLGYIE